jgi:outer membrane protein OmpA-like peptidoglycan-associated protein
MRNLFLAACIMLLWSSFLPAGSADFGTKNPGLFNLKGTIYYLSDDTNEMPADIEKRKPQGVIYTDKLDIPLRNFTEGFPGVTGRFEWFGLVYTGTFEIVKAGLYKWRIESDDGSRLWIDGREIINNDGIHGMDNKEGELKLSNGLHAIKVWYFQGPATEVGLRLFVTRPGEKNEKIFSLSDFSPTVSNAIKTVNAQATKDGIRVELDARFLFDTNKYELKPSALSSVKSLVQIIVTYPGCLVKVEGHTDNVGRDEDNQKLSENRARSVKESLLKTGVPINTRFEVTGHGKTKPVADNTTEKGREKNRRVEILIVP